MNELALFAGAGGGILGGKLLGWRTVCAVERDAYAAQVLAQRQNDGILEPFPIWSDITTFDGRPWRGIVDVVSGGFPCQDVSAAGGGLGIENGERSGLWVEMDRIVDEVRPEIVYVENSPMLTSRGLGRVLGDLAALGYDARWGVLGAADVGAPHIRDRIWILANTRCRRFSESKKGQDQQPWRTKIVSAGAAMANTNRLRQSQSKRVEQKQRQWPGNGRGDVSDTKFEGLERHREHAGKSKIAESGHNSWWLAEPDVGRVAHGVAHRVDRLKALGNGQVPAVAATAWQGLKHD